tara:strand:+ start:4462 stop:5508 length:1047 start_codon:yes stop_codon:yes gene_type:complete
MYSVAAFINDLFIFQSDIVGTREEANEIMNLLKSSNTGDIAFQLYKHFPRGRLINSTKSINYSSMNLYNHDALPFTYILEAPTCSSDAALFNGEWSEEYVGWILNQSQARRALVAGVTKDLFDDNIDFELDELKCMTIYHIDGERYLLEPHPECSVLRQKSFALGRWKSKHGGWVLKGDVIINHLNTLGVPFYSGDDEDDDDDYEQAALTLLELGDDDEVYTYDNFTIEHYKRGLLMKCPSNHPLRGEKYLGTGFWNKTLGGWVFKQDALEDLQANGAQLIKVEEGDSPLSTMTFSTYGKGFLVFPPADHPDFGAKYYHDGFWMPKYDAWFFRGRFGEFVRSSGATEV